MAWGTPKQGTAQNKTVTEGIIIECNWRERSLKKTNTWINTLCLVPQITSILIRNAIISSKRNSHKWQHEAEEVIW